jgi:hypothetical protein
MKPVTMKAAEVVFSASGDRVVAEPSDFWPNGVTGEEGVEEPECSVSIRVPSTMSRDHAISIIRTMTDKVIGAIEREGFPKFSMAMDAEAAVLLMALQRSVDHSRTGMTHLLRSGRRRALQSTPNLQ